MSVSNDSTVLGTVEDGRALLSSAFLEFCVKVRNNDPSILPAPGEPFRIRRLSENEGMELADALLENTNVTDLELEMDNHTKSSAEAMAKYMGTSKRLQRIRFVGSWNNRELQHREEIICCFLHAFQESTSLKELYIIFSLIAGLTSLAFESMLTHTQSLRSLSFICRADEDINVAAASSGLKKNTTLRELTLDFSRCATRISPILTILRDHPLLRRLCLRGYPVDLTGLETLLLSETSKITELEIQRAYPGPTIGLTPVLQALGRRPTLTKLALRRVRLRRDEVTLLRMALSNIPSLQSLVLAWYTLGSAGLAELAPALYDNTSIKVLDLSDNYLNDMDSARLLRDILRRNKTMTNLDLSNNTFGRSPGAVDCISSGMGSNSTLLKIDLTYCALGDDGVSILAQSLGSRNTTLQKLILCCNAITSTGIGVLLEAMEHSSHHITDLDLRRSYIEDEGASLLARSLGGNALTNLTRLCLYDCGVGDDGFITLVSALEQNTSLLQLDLRHNGFSERAYFALAESLPEIKVLQQVDFNWCTGLVSAMPLLLAGLRENTSLFRFHVAGCAPSSVPPIPENMDKCAGGWIQEMERLGYRNRFHTLIRAPKERLPPLGVWPRALARVATLPDVIFEVLRSKPNLVPSEDTEGEEAAEDTVGRRNASAVTTESQSLSG
jgi:Ran GTPase-activating protein (RanGAP) involved in mRNA processing and transport